MDQTLTLRTAQETDADQISALVQRTVRISNAQDYSAAVIARVVGSFTAETVLGFLKSREVLVACRGEAIVGTASLDGDVVRAVFVAPEVQGMGVGQKLMAVIESVAAQNGVRILTVPASLTGKPFYIRLGYREVREVQHGEERTFVMDKALS